MQSLRMANDKILIIGAGLAGLSLAQGLKQAQIPFKIFERDAAASFRAQGYRIRIDANGGDALQRLLSPELFEKFDATCSEVVPRGQRLDALTGQIDDTGESRMPPRTGNAWNADRTVLRNILLTDLEGEVSFGKTLRSYELVKDGVIATFTDGSTEEGAMLVGADGIRSVVQKQLLPDHVLLDTEGRAVFGKTPIEDSTLSSLPAQIDQGLTLIADPDEPRVRMLCDTMRFKHDKDENLPQDYVYWVLVFQKVMSTKSDKELSSLSHAESATLAKALTARWHPLVRSIVEQQAQEASSTLSFCIVKPPVQSRPLDRRVTVIGDSAHQMPPVGGTGANTAFQDAADLSDVIRQQGGDDAFAKFEEKIRDRSTSAITMSAKGAGHFFGMKPVEQLRPVSW